MTHERTSFEPESIGILEEIELEDAHRLRSQICPQKEFEQKLQKVREERQAEAKEKREKHLVRLKHQDAWWLVGETLDETIANIVGFCLLNVRGLDALVLARKRLAIIAPDILFGDDRSTCEQKFDAAFKSMERKKKNSTLKKAPYLVFLPSVKRDVLDHIPENRMCYNGSKRVLPVEIAFIAKTITHRVLENWGEKLDDTVRIANSYFVPPRRGQRNSKSKTKYHERYRDELKRSLNYTKLAVITELLDEFKIVEKTKVQPKNNPQQYAMNAYRIGINNVYRRVLLKRKSDNG